MSCLLSGKTILITGGTSRLGKSFVEKAMGEGARIFFTYHTSEVQANALMARGAQGYRLNLADMRSIDDFIKSAKDELKDLDVLIHNGATTRDHSLLNLTEEDWDEVMTVNLKAPYYLTKKLLPIFLKRPGSKIFMITSRLAFWGGFGVANYAASKAGLVGLAKSLAQELGKRRILVNAVNPGFMLSRMTEGLAPEVIEKNRGLSFLGELSDPDEVADFLISLCSDRMTRVTGQIFHWESRKT